MSLKSSQSCIYAIKQPDLDDIMKTEERLLLVEGEHAINFTMLCPELQIFIAAELSIHI